MAWTELSFDPDSVASTSDLASSALAEANTASGAAATASDIASSALALASDAASKATVALSKASDASVAAAAVSDTASDAASKASVAYAKASAASVAAAGVASVASDASSLASDAMVKASAASVAVAAKKAILYNTTPADTVDDGFTGSFVASGVLARGQICYVKAAGTVAKANANSAATASGLLVLSPASVADTGSFAAIMPGTMVGHSAWNWTLGAPIFMGSSAGSMTQTRPSAASAIVRVVGYGGRNSNVMFFNPDNTWIEVT